MGRYKMCGKVLQVNLVEIFLFDISLDIFRKNAIKKKAIIKIREKITPRCSKIFYHQWLNSIQYINISKKEKYSYFK